MPILGDIHCYHCDKARCKFTSIDSESRYEKYCMACQVEGIEMTLRHKKEQEEFDKAGNTRYRKYLDKINKKVTKTKTIKCKICAGLVLVPVTTRNQKYCKPCADEKEKEYKRDYSYRIRNGLQTKRQELKEDNYRYGPRKKTINECLKIMEKCEKGNKSLF